MAAILDYCVPSRRRERIERKEKRALASRVDSRWGDAQITAPSEGGWNQPASFDESQTDSPSVPSLESSPGNSSKYQSSVNTTPDLSLFDDRSTTGLAIETEHENHLQPRPKEEKNNITFTITLPWPSRRTNARRASLSQPTTAVPPKVEASDQTSRPSTSHAAPPPVVYKPMSVKHMQDLAGVGQESDMINPLAQYPPDHVQIVPPGQTPVPLTEGNIKAMLGNGMMPGTPLSHGPTHARHISKEPDLRHRASPHTQDTSPGTRLATIPASPYYVDSSSDGDPNFKRPDTAKSSQPPAVEKRSRDRSTSRGPPVERRSRMRSTSREPTEDRINTVRSRSRGAIEDKVATTRSSSRKPGVDRTSTSRSSSVSPAQDYIATARISAREATTHRFGTARSASCDAAPERAGRLRCSSVGPPTGRIARVRSASREKIAERAVYTRTRRRASYSSDSSSASFFSDEETDDSEVQHQQAEGKAVDDGIPRSNDYGETIKPSKVQRPLSKAFPITPGGYYSSLASEYRQIAKDAEIKDFVESKISERKEKPKPTKERAKSTSAYTRPQELVPRSVDLYG